MKKLLAVAAIVGLFYFFSDGGYDQGFKDGRALREQNGSSKKYLNGYEDGKNETLYRLGYQDALDENEQRYYYYLEYRRGYEDGKLENDEK